MWFENQEINHDIPEYHHLILQCILHVYVFFFSSIKHMLIGLMVQLDKKKNIYVMPA